MTDLECPQRNQCLQRKVVIIRNTRVHWKEMPSRAFKKKPASSANCSSQAIYIHSSGTPALFHGTCCLVWRSMFLSVVVVGRILQKRSRGRRRHLRAIAVRPDTWVIYIYSAMPELFNETCCLVFPFHVVVRVRYIIIILLLLLWLLLLYYNITVLSLPKIATPAKATVNPKTRICCLGLAQG